LYQSLSYCFFFFFQAEDGIRDFHVTGVQTCALPISEINLPYITADATGPKHLVINVTRAKLEGLVADLVARTIEPCKIALKDAGLSTSDISDVILVGGQSRMPMVQQKVQEFF